jgi:hypothetical protein
MLIEEVRGNSDLFFGWFEIGLSGMLSGIPIVFSSASLDKAYQPMYNPNIFMMVYMIGAMYVV